MRFIRSHPKILAAIIISTAAVLAVASAWDDSLIVDEIPHIGAGYSYLARGDMRLNPEHPPLPKDLAGLALKFLRLKEDAFTTDFWNKDINGQWEFGRRLIYNSGNDAELITHVAKLPLLAFFVLSAVLIFHWGRRLYGRTGGLIALLLFSFSPTVLAHSRFVTTDVPALFGVLAATVAFLNYLRQSSRRNFWLAGLAFGLALLTKFSTFLLAPYFVLLAIFWGWTQTEQEKIKNIARKLGKTILVFLAGFTVVVWPIYYFHVWRYPADRQQSETRYHLGTFGKRYLADPVVWGSGKPILRAAAHYGLGLLMVTQRSAGGNTTYFLGETSNHGWRSYFPIVYLIKEPLAWWALVILTLISLAWHNFRRGLGFVKKHFTEFAMLLWLVIYWSSSLRSLLNIGVRHLLPIYPFAILLVSGRITHILSRIKNYESRVMGKSRKSIVLTLYFVILSLLGWYLLENIRIYPYYLAYFNQLAGGAEGGHRFVVDSNLDWGQDLKRLAQWLEKYKVPKIEADYFGWADPAYYLGNRYIYLTAKKYKDEKDFIAKNESNGWLAVSATFFQGTAEYNWLRKYKPVATVGHSIFIYQIR